MLERRPTDASRSGVDRRNPRRSRRPALERLEERQLLATLANIPSPVQVPSGLGYQLPLTGGADNQTYTATSSNPDIAVTPTNGKFWTVSITHTAADSGDVSFSGSMTFQLFGDLTPNTVQQLEQLITSGYYTSPTQPTDGSPPLASKNFHRIVSGFAAQAGSLTGNGTGNLTAPGFPFADEFNQQLVFDGNAQLAMANAGNDTNDSQFFITYGPQRSLDFNYTIFGQLVSGLDTLSELSQVEVKANSSGEKSQPLTPVLITSSTLSDVNPNGVLHIDTTKAQPGETGTVTVTAHDPTNGSTATRTFTVGVTANTDSNGTPIVEPAFLNPVNNLVIATGQTAKFALSATNPQPTSTLNYVVSGGTTTDSSGNKTFSAVQNATASVDASGIVTLTPKAGYTGVINLLVGVTNKAGASAGLSGNPSDYDTQAMTVTVQNGQAVKLPPIAANGQQSVPTGSATTISLPGALGNPDTGGPLTYTVIQGPQHGTLANFNSATGTFDYTPAQDYLGPDSVRYRVTDASNPMVTSDTGTYTINVTGANTNAVRVIDRTLIVTPPPNPGGGPNTIDVSVVNGIYVVKVNGVTDVNQPADAAIDNVIVYGAKASDTINVDPSVTVPALLGGGRGGVNVINAGSGDSILHGWFGKNTLTGGIGRDYLIGRKGYVQAKYSPGGDLVFVGQAHPGQRKNGTPVNPASFFFAPPGNPTGKFYVFGPNKRLVPVSEAGTASAHGGSGSLGGSSSGLSPAAQRRQALLAARQSQLQNRQAEAAAQRAALQARHRNA